MAYKPQENTDILHIENPEKHRSRNRRIKTNNLGNAYTSAMDVHESHVNHRQKSQVPIHYDEELNGRKLASQYSPRDTLRDSN